jgi:hypothetical protein
MVPNLMNKIRVKTRVRHEDGSVGEVVSIDFSGTTSYPIKVRRPSGAEIGYTMLGTRYISCPDELDIVEVLGDIVRDESGAVGYKQDVHLDSLDFFRKKMGW